MTRIGSDWRVLAGVATAWFDARSLSESAALVGLLDESEGRWRVTDPEGNELVILSGG